MRALSTDRKVAALATAPLFAGLGRREMRQLAQVAESVDVKPGKVLVREGKSATEFFVIVEGQFGVTRDGRTISELGPGDFFGEIALIESSRRSATVTAKTDGRLFVLTRRAFWDLLDSDRDVERRVLRAVAKRLLATVADPTTP
ncbi:MAG: cyclic nucleotide-binding domain-containing protein [Actinomycetota bacterium]|nr:cyclic nucleotide-binding domain-containing protein [Actinomycetota bacterium]